MWGLTPTINGDAHICYCSDYGRPSEFVY